MTLYAEVILSLPIRQSFFYVVPEEYKGRVKIGSRVLVPLQQRHVTGFVIKLREKSLPKNFKFKEINELLDEEPVFSSSFLSFTQKIGEYYYSSWGELLQASLPPSYVLQTKTRIAISEKGSEAIKDKTLSEEERNILQMLQKKSYSTVFLKRKLNTRNFLSLLTRLEKKGLVHFIRDIQRKTHRKERKVQKPPVQLEMDFSLDKNSRQIADLSAGKIGKEVFTPFLLLGSPKEREAVYFYLIKRTLDLGKKVLFLVPEISLTKTLLEKFEKHLGESTALLHSQQTERMKEVEWKRIKAGDVDVVVGPRSALFSPLGDIGLIIVDEEQDESYYQQENPSYDARKGAWIRAKQVASVLIYGSAVPSVEALYKAKKRGYLLRLESGPEIRDVEIVDDRDEREIISRSLKQRITQALNQSRPILVFYNRRGYSSFLICSRCNTIPRCVQCDIALAYHKREEKLVCHYCNFTIPKMNNCPECNSRIIRKRGFGIEVVEEELRRRFPQARVALFDTDVVKKKTDQQRILSDFRQGKIDILVGTKLLIHKDDLPPVSLVVIIHPEMTLTLSDFRASQKAFWIINQMKKFLIKDEQSKLIIQTALPHHYSIRQAALGDYMAFYRQEVRFRRLMNYPPFSHMVEVLLHGQNLRALARESRAFSSLVKSTADDVEVLGPALASVSRMRGRSRVQMILKSKKKKSLDRVLKMSLKEIKSRKTVLIFE